MSDANDADSYIVCDSCDEIIDADADNCPSCGKTAQGMGPIIATVLGAVIAVTTATQIGELWFFTLVGIALAVAGGWLVWGKRQRIAEAQERLESGEEPWSPN